MNVYIEHFFSYPVAIIDMGNRMKNLFNQQKKSVEWYENVHEHCHKNYQSKSLDILKDYPEEHDFLLNCAEKYKNEIFKWDSVNLKITTSWMTKTEQNGFSKPHSHKNSLISGVAYDDVDGQGHLVFHSPKTLPFLPCSPSSFTHQNCTDYSIAPAPNSLILFESNLEHHIGKHPKEDTRFSLAFNTFPIGNVGDFDSSIKIL